MTPIPVSGPTLEPVSLAEAKLWLRVDTSTDDELIAMLLSAARLGVEAMTRTLLITQSWRLIADRWPSPEPISLPLCPLRNLQAIRVYDPSGAAQTIAAETYTLHVTPQSARLRFTTPPPQPGREVAGIEMDVMAGFGDTPGDVPQPLRQAMLLLVARWYENRGDASADVMRPPADIEMLIAPYRRPRLA